MQKTENSSQTSPTTPGLLTDSQHGLLTDNGDTALLTRKEHRLCVAVFLLMGTAALYFWNSVISTMYTIIYARFPEDAAMSDTIFATYCSLAFVSTVLLYIVVPTKPLYNLVGGTLLCIMTILYPATALYSPVSACLHTSLPSFSSLFSQS